MVNLFSELKFEGSQNRITTYLCEVIKNDGDDVLLIAFF